MFLNPHSEFIHIFNTSDSDVTSIKKKKMFILFLKGASQKTFTFIPHHNVTQKEILNNVGNFKVRDPCSYVNSNFLPCHSFVNNNKCIKCVFSKENIVVN